MGGVVGNTRRRGEDLLAAIHVAVHDELAARGYAGLTFEGVAAAAATSKAVLYRRWPTKAEMVLSALTTTGQPILTVPDSGSLTGDLHQLMRAGRAFFREQTRQTILGLLADVDEYAAETMREIFFARAAEMVTPILDRARERGELGPAPIPPRAVVLPLDLLRHETLLRGKLDEHDISELVDQCVVPLLVALSTTPVSAASR
jgi:AcrR family transcriptional regulator